MKNRDQLYTNRVIQELNKFRQEFNYRYVGGGYFRDKTVAKGISADMKHGDDVIGQFCDDFADYLSKLPPPEPESP